MVATDLDGVDVARRIVYFDESYPTGWIGRPPNKQQDQPRVIRDFLVARGFVALDAPLLRAWMEDRVRCDDASGTVVVFSQDVLPATVAHAASPNALVRTFLDHGGRIVWLGDIPGWQVGHPSKKQASAPLGELGPYAIFGLYPIFVHSPRGAVSATRRAKKIGVFESRWYGIRPMASIGGGSLKRLAQSRARPPLEAKAMLPQLVTDPGKAFVSTALRMVLNLRDFSVALAALFGGIGILAALLGGPAQPSALVLGASSFVLALADAWVIGELWRVRKRANAWYKGYGRVRPGWLVRVWDHDPPNISQGMLRDLESIASFEPQTWLLGDGAS